MAKWIIKRKEKLYGDLIVIGMEKPIVALSVFWERYKSSSFFIIYLDESLITGM